MYLKIRVAIFSDYEISINLTASISQEEVRVVTVHIRRMSCSREFIMHFDSGTISVADALKCICQRHAISSGYIEKSYNVSPFAHVHVMDSDLLVSNKDFDYRFFEIEQQQQHVLPSVVHSQPLLNHSGFEGSSRVSLAEATAAELRRKYAVPYTSGIVGGLKSSSQISSIPTPRFVDKACIKKRKASSSKEELISGQQTTLIRDVLIVRGYENAILCGAKRVSLLLMKEYLEPKEYFTNVAFEGPDDDRNAVHQKLSQLIGNNAMDFAIVNPKNNKGHLFVLPYNTTTTDHCMTIADLRKSYPKAVDYLILKEREESIHTTVLPTPPPIMTVTQVHNTETGTNATTATTPPDIGTTYLEPTLRQCVICQENTTMCFNYSCGHCLCGTCYQSPGAEPWKSKCPFKCISKHSMPTTVSDNNSLVDVDLSLEEFNA